MNPESMKYLSNHTRPRTSGNKPRAFLLFRNQNCSQEPAPRYVIKSTANHRKKTPRTRSNVKISFAAISRRSRTAHVVVQCGSSRDRQQNLTGLRNVSSINR
ncbi:unnamed protein product, partial [Ectocarpus sp. 13 AM-2016]